MKYGKLFRMLVDKYNFTPSKNRCSLLPYKELKSIAKIIYEDTKEMARILGVNNPLSNYVRQSKDVLTTTVYNALEMIY